MVRETEEFASVIDSSINETKSHASVAGLYDSGTGVDEYETEADDSETQANEYEIEADENDTEADDSETQADEYETEADENDTEADDSETQADEYETEADENDADADDNGTKADEYVRYANKTLTQSTFRQIVGSRASKKTNDSPLDVELQKVDWWTGKSWGQASRIRLKLDDNLLPSSLKLVAFQSVPSPLIFY